MSELKQYHQHGQTLSEKLRLQTFPLAIQLVKNQDQFPEKVRRPSMFNMKVTMCQGYTFSRRIGWTMGLTAEDMNCTPNLVAYGFHELKDEQGFIEAFRAMDYYETDAAAATMREHFPMLKPGEYEGIIISPLGWTKIEPDVILIHGNSTQIMRLIQANIYTSGAPIVTKQMGLAASCVNGVLQTFLTRKPNVIIPGAGDHVYAAVQDHEILFTLPVEMLNETITSLDKAGVKVGIRYPMPINLTEPPIKPIAWQILDKYSQPARK